MECPHPTVFVKVPPQPGEEEMLVECLACGSLFLEPIEFKPYCGCEGGDLGCQYPRACFL